MNNLSWRGIRAFILIAEHGSFTAAADTSGFSKSNLSQLVSDLEASLNVQLLHRTTRRLRLTEVGEGYYQRCKQAMKTLDSAAEWAAQSTDKLQGVIRINSVGGMLGEELIAPIVLAFQQRYPEVKVHLDFSSVRVDLIEDQYDLVLRMGKMPDSTLIARKLHTMTTRYVASPDFLRRHGPIKQPDDLKTLPLIYGSVDHWTMNSGTEERVIHAVNGMKLINGRVMRKAAIDGLGITRLVDIYCQADIANGRLVEVLPAWSEATPISLVSPPLRHQLERVKALKQWLVEHFKPEYEQLLQRGYAD